MALPIVETVAVLFTKTFFEICFGGRDDSAATVKVNVWNSVVPPVTMAAINVAPTLNTSVFATFLIVENADPILNVIGDLVMAFFVCSVATTVTVLDALIPF